MSIRYLVLLLVAELTLISGQSVKPYILCEDEDITVNAGSSGNISHTKRDSNRPCTLILSGLTSDSRVSIPGVDKSTNNQCNPGYPAVNINRVLYCVTDTKSLNTVVIVLSDGHLNITLPSADVPQFTIKYFNNGKQTSE